MYCRICTLYENFKLKLCTCAQSHALGTRTNFQIEILTINVISGVVYFRENILGSLRNVSETAPGFLLGESTGDSRDKGPATRKPFPFSDVIMACITIDYMRNV